MSSLHADNSRASTGVRKGLDHVLLGMKSIRSGEGEGEPATCSSCWEHTPAKMAVTKYGELLWEGVLFQCQKRKESQLNFKKND